MKTLKSKLLCVMLSLVLVFSMFVATATTAFAESEGTASSTVTDTVVDGTISGTENGKDENYGSTTEKDEYVSQSMNILRTNVTEIHYTDDDKGNIYKTEFFLEVQNEIASFQIELVMPDFLGVTNVTAGSSLCQSATDSFMANIQDSPTVNVTYSSANALPVGENWLFTVYYMVNRPMNVQGDIGINRTTFTNANGDYVDNNNIAFSLAPIYLKYDNGGVVNPTYNKGDVNMDGNVDLQDLIKLQRAITYYEDLYEAYGYADIDNNGTLDMRDCQIMQMYLVGKISLSDLNNYGGNGGGGQENNYFFEVTFVVDMDGQKMSTGSSGTQVSLGQSIRELAKSMAVSRDYQIVDVYYDYDCTEVVPESAVVVGGSVNVYVLVQMPSIAGEYDLYDAYVDDYMGLQYTTELLGKVVFTETDATITLNGAESVTASYTNMVGTIFVNLSDLEQYIFIIVDGKVYKMNYFNGNGYETQEIFTAVAGEYTVLDAGDEEDVYNLVLFDTGVYNLSYMGITFMGTYTYEGDMFYLDQMGQNATCQLVDTENKIMHTIYENNGGGSGDIEVPTVPEGSFNVYDMSDSEDGTTNVAIVGKADLKEGIAKIEYNGEMIVGSYSSMEGAIFIITETFEQYIFAPCQDGFMFFSYFDGSAYEESEEFLSAAGDYVILVEESGMTIEMYITFNTNGTYRMEVPIMNNVVMLGSYTYADGVYSVADFQGAIGTFQKQEGSNVLIALDLGGSSNNNTVEMAKYPIYALTDGEYTTVGTLVLDASNDTATLMVMGTEVTCNCKIYSDGTIEIISNDGEIERLTPYGEGFLMATENSGNTDANGNGTVTEMEQNATGDVTEIVITDNVA